MKVDRPMIFNRNAPQRKASIDLLFGDGGPWIVREQGPRARPRRGDLCAAKVRAAPSPAAGSGAGGKPLRKTAGGQPGSRFCAKMRSSLSS